MDLTVVDSTHGLNTSWQYDGLNSIEELSSIDASLQFGERYLEKKN